MLTKPAIADESILACLYGSFGLRIVDATFLPLGADINSAVYRVTADDGIPYFLKLRRGNFDEVAVAVPARLHAQGIRAVMAPIATPTGELRVRAHDFDWILYPFFEGKDGYEVALSQVQWITLGATMQAVHAARLPAELEARVRREVFSPRWRRIVRTYHRQVAERVYDDPIAARLAAFWQTERDEIACIVERAEELAGALRRRVVEVVVCHADLHGGNVLVGADDELRIVDWDEIKLAPKERDLMSVAGGLFGRWSTPQESAWFYAGYGETMIDPIALAYYRYERIVADIAEFADQIFGMQGIVEDREQGLHLLMGQFLPNAVIAIAHRTYAELA